MNAIAAGSQLHAPDGYHCLEKGVTYYFLRNSATSGRVLLIQFCLRPMKAVQHKSQRRPKRNITPIAFPVFHCLQRSVFESGIKAEKIKKCDTCSRYLPGLPNSKCLKFPRSDRCVESKREALSCRSH